MATAKNMPGDSADLFGDGTTEDGGAANGRLWRTVIIGEQEHRIDLHMIRPYMKVVTHGGETRPPAPPWGSSPARRATGSLSVPLFEPQSLCLMHWDVKPSTRLGWTDCGQGVHGQAGAVGAPDGRCHSPPKAETG